MILHGWLKWRSILSLPFDCHILIKNLRVKSTVQWYPDENVKWMMTNIIDNDCGRFV